LIPLDYTNSATQQTTYGAKKSCQSVCSITNEIEAIEAKGFIVHRENDCMGLKVP